MVQLSHPCVTTGKTIALTIQTFVGKVMSLLFNMLSGLFITFLPRSEHLLISWLQPPSAVILEPKETKSVTASTFPPSICHKGCDRIPSWFFSWFSFFHVQFQASFFTLLFHPHQEALYLLFDFCH